MLQLYDRMLQVMDATFQGYEAHAPKPVQVAFLDGWRWRHPNPDIYQAMLLKLALIHSTLAAALTLHRSGHFLQQAMLQRVIEDANEDVAFLVYAVTNDSITELHERFLAAFWSEEFDEVPDPIGGHQSRPMVPRKKIRAYIATREGAANPSAAIAAGKVINKTYSGFVHGAAGHILECYGGVPPQYHTQDMRVTGRRDEYEQDLWNYMFRGFCSFVLVGKALGAGEHVEALMEYKKRFEQTAGKEYG